MALVEAVHAQTEGNPFFVGEVVRLLREEGALTPESVPHAGALERPYSRRCPRGRRATARAPLTALQLDPDDRLRDRARVRARPARPARRRPRRGGAPRGSGRGACGPRRRGAAGHRRSVPVHARPDPGDARRRAVANAAGAAPRTDRRGSGDAVRRRGRPPTPPSSLTTSPKPSPCSARDRLVRYCALAGESALAARRPGAGARPLRARARRDGGRRRPTIEPPSCCSVSVARSWRRSGTTSWAPR